jgi:diguanylate cyclase (GGDEF)-like protein
VTEARATLVDTADVARGSRNRRNRDRVELQVLQRVALALASSLSFSEVLNALARELVFAIDRACECAISLWDVEGDKLVDAAAYTENGPPSWPRGLNENPLSEYPHTRALLQAGRGCYSYRITDPGLRREDRDVLETWGWRAAIELPLVVEGRSVGLVEIADYRSARPWSERDTAFCQTIASQAALAVRNAQLYEDLRQRVDRDSLTGLLNHRAFYERLRQELARAHRGSYQVAVMMIDLDSFKQLNDSRGHLVGDEALRCSADALQSVCRTDDIAGRVGGDEFAVILVGVGDDVEMISHRMVRTIADSSPVTASLGVAVAGKDDLDPVRLMARADLALLEAKAGRQRVGLRA